MAENNSLERRTYDNKENRIDNKGRNEPLNYGYKYFVYINHL